MAKTILRNFAALLALTFVSLEYLLLYAGLMPDRHALMVNIVLVPLLFGCAGFFLLKATLPVKLALMALLPVVHVIYLGGDDAKPGLKNMVAAVELVFISIGVVLGYLARRFLFRRFAGDRSGKI